MLQHLHICNSVASELCRKLPRGVERRDLEQAGVFGLVAAIKSYDQRHGVEFWVYARIRIRGSILDYLRELCWEPRILREGGGELVRMEQMTLAHSRIAAKPDYNPIDEADGLEHWLRCLPERWRQVVRLRVLDDCTFREIGERLSPQVTENRAHQIYRDAESMILNAGAKVDRKFVSNQV